MKVEEARAQSSASSKYTYAANRRGPGSIEAGRVGRVMSKDQVMTRISRGTILQQAEKSQTHADLRIGIWRATPHKGKGVG
jgi:hypothetical protein